MKAYFSLDRIEPRWTQLKKVDRYLKLVKVARYAPLAILATGIVLSELLPTGEAIPKGKDDSAL
jgi:hypothetical protein